MTAVALRLLDLMRLRSGPQDLPAGWLLAGVLAVLYLFQGLMADRLLNPEDDAPRSLVAISVQLLLTAALLRQRGLFSRMPQTVSALAGTGLLFGFISSFLVLQVNPDEAQPLLVLLWFGTFLWSLLVDAHIYRNALSLTMSLGMLVAVVVFAVNFFLIEKLFSG